MATLGIIPLYARSDDDLRLAEKCIESFRKSAPPDAELMIVNDASPYPELLEFFGDLMIKEYEIQWRGHDENKGFAATVNVGLRAARDAGMHALLINSDIEFITKGNIERMESREEYVVGAQLLFPTGFIQHAGIFFSVLRREFDHIYRLGPPGLPAAQIPRFCPVTGALQFIRYECLMEFGLYDENFRLGYEDIDYCQRVFIGGQQCVYDPEIVAVHHEGFSRKQNTSRKQQEMHDESFVYLHEKWAGHDFSAYIPTLIEELDAL